MNARKFLQPFSILFMLLLCAGGSFAQETYWENGKVKTKMEEGDDGSITEYNYDEDGTLRRKAVVNDDLIQTTRYYENGLLESVLSQRVTGFNVVNHGNCEAYYPSGDMQSKSYWENGKREGDYKEYHANGKLKAQGRFRMDHYVGQWMFYFDNGSVQREVNYAETGSMSGVEKRFDENGDVVLEQEFFEGKLKSQRLVPESYANALNSIYGLFQREGEGVPFEATYLSEEYEYKIDGTKVEKGIQTNYVINKGDGFARLVATPAEMDMQGGMPDKQRVTEITIVENNVLQFYDITEEVLIIADYDGPKVEAAGMTFDDDLSSYTVIDIAESENDQGETIESITMIAHEPAKFQNMVIRINRTTGKLDGWSYHQRSGHMTMRCDVVGFKINPVIDGNTFKASTYMPQEPLDTLDLREN